MPLLPFSNKPPAGGANTALSNLIATAINTSLISDTDSTDDLGSSTIFWANLFVDTIYIGQLGGINYWKINSDQESPYRMNFHNTGVGEYLFKSISSSVYYFLIDVEQNSPYNVTLSAGGAAGNIRFAASYVAPSADSAYNLGSSTLYWLEGYFDKLYLNATATLDGATAGIIGVTGVFSSVASNILSTTTGIDAKVVATTNLYTVPTGKTAIITAAVIRCTAATAITVVPTLGIGIAAGESDIIASTALTGLDSTGEFYRFSVEGTVVTGAAAAVIKLGIDTGATATTMTIAVDLIGYLV